MRVLGISAFFHDSAAAIVDTEVGILAAAEEERFSRVKHDNRFPALSIDFCLREAGVKACDIDAVVFYELPAVKFHRVLMNWLATQPRSEVKLGDWLPGWRHKKAWTKEIIAAQMGIDARKIHFVSHHDSHAYGAFALSGFESAAVLTLDGVGEWECGMLGEIGVDGQLRRFHSLNFPHSLGLLYSAFAEYLGFEVNEGEFKVMGMAAYGVAKYTEQVKKLFLYTQGGGFRLDMTYFEFHRSARTNLSDRFIRLFGKPRLPEAQFFISDSDDRVSSEQQRFADIAKSLQVVFEELVLKFASELRELSGRSKLVFSGGVAYNSVANGRLIRESGFDQVFVMPAAGDSGSAIGAAYAHIISNRLGAGRLSSMNLGFKSSKADIVRAVERFPKEKVTKAVQDTSLISAIVDRLIVGQVGALYLGRSEFGPRALGFRSIIADPRPSGNKARVNSAIKFREIFRPFAPMVSYDDALDYFDHVPLWQPESPFNYMQAVTTVKAEARALLGATTHVDGTARVQTVHPCHNPFVYQLLKAFKEKAGVPVLLNTSFNRRGEPIVNTIEEAISVFEWTDLDFLVTEVGILSK